MPYNTDRIDADDLEARLSRISHDLRTPLARLRMEIEVSNLPQTARLGIDEDIAHIDYCFKQLMEYARPARAMPSVATDVSAKLVKLCDSERRHAESLGVDLRVQLAPNLKSRVPVRSIGVMVRQLIDNALRYGRSSDEKSRVDLSLYAEKTALIITVSDHGVGIPAKDIPRLKQPFFRGKSMQHFGDCVGLGLGLPIVERLLSQMGGALHLSNRDTGGLTARVELPIA